jgi:hypothetical protein
MKHLYEYESWSDYKTPAELRSRIQAIGKERAKDFFKKRTTGGKASDMFTDDVEFKQDMKEVFLENGCNTNSQLDFLISLNPSKGDLTEILIRNNDLLKGLKELMASYSGSIEKVGRSTEEFESYIDNIIMVNQAINDIIHG